MQGAFLSLFIPELEVNTERTVEACCTRIPSPLGGKRSPERFPARPT